MDTKSDYTYKSWNQLISKNIVNTMGIRKEVYQSWLRSKYFNVNPHLFENQVVDKSCIKIYSNNHLSLNERLPKEFTYFVLDDKFNVLMKISAESSNSGILDSLYHFDEVLIGTNVAVLAEENEKYYYLNRHEHYIASFHDFSMACVRRIINMKETEKLIYIVISTDEIAFDSVQHKKMVLDLSAIVSEFYLDYVNTLAYEAKSIDYTLLSDMELSNKTNNFNNKQIYKSNKAIYKTISISIDNLLSVLLEPRESKNFVLLIDDESVEQLMQIINLNHSRMNGYAIVFLLNQRSVDQMFFSNVHNIEKDNLWVYIALKKHIIIEDVKRRINDFQVVDITNENIQAANFQTLSSNIRLENELSPLLVKSDMDNQELLIIKDVIIKEENLGHTLTELEEEVIRFTLKQNRGNKLKAAKVLGVSRSTLYRKLKEYGISE